MFRVKVILDRDFGLAFAAELPADDSCTAVWIPESGDSLTLEAFIPTSAGARSRCRQWRDLLKKNCPRPPPVTVAEIPDADWATDWRKHFKLQHITDRLVVCPPWEAYAARPDEMVVRIDPGMSFGTGQHPTTRDCLRFLAQCLESRNSSSLRFLDIGCGSGILSVAAVLMGFDTVVAIDNDSQSLKDTVRNSELNQVAGQVCCRTADLGALGASETYDVVAANLFANLLCRHSSAISALVSADPPGDLIVAGILQSQYAEVRTVFSQQGFHEIEVSDDGNWRSGWLRRTG